MSGIEHVSQHHRTTLEHIGHHPTTHNLEWNDVIGMLEEIADVREEHDGKYIVKLGDERIVLTKPRHKDVDEQMVLDLRRMLRGAGYLQAKP
jgi:ribulose bisphosphate carboxylase small subunit